MSRGTTTTDQREWDLVVYGATGDTGTAIALYVANNIHTYYKKSGTDNNNGDETFRWAIAGRSEHKLNRLRSRIIVSRTTPSANDEIGVLTADVASAEATSDLAKSTRVLISTVGPYKILGESIYAACVNHGTNYVDITGEIDWVASMREKYQKRAEETGSTLCSFAGYDCVPCDIMMYAAHKVLSECDGDDVTTVISSAETVALYSGEATVPRGTIRTAISKLPESVSFCRQLVRFPLDSNAHVKTTLALIKWLLPTWSPELGAFTVPHLMGWCNIPVIYSSHSSYMDCIYNDRFILPYSQNYPRTGYGLLQLSFLIPIFLLIAPWFLCLQILIALIPSTCDLLLKAFDAFQYRGNRQNNQKKLDSAITDVWNFVKSNSGTKATVHLLVKGDPGIKCTALLAAETAFSMLTLLDENKLPKGVIGSPSQIVGDALVDRLQDEETIGHYCTLTVEVEEEFKDNDDDRNNKKED